MITTTVKVERQNATEFGYGLYVNGYADEGNGINMIHASECLPFTATDAQIAAASRRVRRAAWRNCRRWLDKF